MQCKVLSLLISGPEPGTAHDLAGTATFLVRELRTRSDLEITRISEATDGQPGSKGAAEVALAELAVAGVFAGSTVTALAQIVIACVRRGAARRIVLSDGARTLTVTDPSAATQQAVVEWLTHEQNPSGSDADA